MHSLHDDIARLLRHVASTVLMPRFGALATSDIFEKSPGEVVTVADQEAERLLGLGLAALDPVARLIGEEACSADPTLLGGIGHGRAWLIDPLDGTANFAAGRGPFGIMVALVEDGESVASWIFDPVRDRLCHAFRGHGAFVDSQRVFVRSSGSQPPIAALATQFLPDDMREALIAEAGRAMSIVPIPRCAAEHYPRLCLGENDIAFFQRTLAWDHVPGALFLVEAGGAVCRWNGEPYRLDDDGIGLIAATSPAQLSIIRGAVEAAGLLRMGK